MHTTLTLFNPKIIGELYDEDQLENDLIDKMAYAIRYYREGHAHYTKNVKGLSDDEYQDCLQLMESLKRLAEDMSIHDDAELVYARKSDQLVLNVSPLYRYIQQTDLSQIINRIKVVKGRMHDYLNCDNFMHLADSYEIMDQWEFVFNEIMKDHGK